MKIHNIPSIIAGLAAMAAMASASVITNINQTFEGYPEGPFSSGGGWAIPVNIPTTIVTDPVYDGTKSMQLERIGAGAITYTTTGTGNIQLNLAPNSEYLWNFAFRIDAASSTNAGASTIGLDTGSGTSFAGLRLEYVGDEWVARYYSNLTNSFSSQISFSSFGSLEADTWYVASFTITTDAALNMSQSTSILSGTNVLYSGSVSNQLSLAGTNTARMIWSPAPNGVIQQYDDLYLATTVEAKFWAEGASGGGTGTWSATGTNWAAMAGIQGESTQSIRSTLIFGGTAGTVAVDGTVIASNGLQFSTDGYVLEGGTAISLGGLSISSNTITTDGDVGATINSALSGTNGLTKAGGGTLILGGTNTYSGNTLVSAGTLIGTTASIKGDITNNDAVILDQATNGAYSGVLSGSGTLHKDGAGTVTFSGSSANTLSGQVTVSNGTLELAKTAGVAAIAGDLAINSGAKLLISTANQVADTSNVTLSGGTIERTSGTSEVFGNLNLTEASFLDYGSGTGGTLAFGTYTSSSLLTVSRFFEGNVLVFSTDLSPIIKDSGLFSFDNGFKYDWDSDTSTFTVTAIPEASACVAAVGLIGLMLWRRSKRA